jgi:hypothetical protein
LAKAADSASIHPRERRERLFAHQFLQGVAELEPLAAADPTTTFSIGWPNDAIARYGDRIYQDMMLLEAHVDITPHMIASVLDTIRNRVLLFALEIWKEDPDAGDAPAAGQAAVSSERVDQIFNTYVVGPTAAVSIGGGAIHQAVEVTVTPGDIESLRAALTQLGIGRSDIRDLEEALAEDAGSAGRSLGPATATWLERFTAGAGEQTTALASGVTSGLLTELIVRFLG